jgi:DNA-binding XRE family transcriptional regulator
MAGKITSCQLSLGSLAGQFLEKSKLAGGIFVPGPPATLLYSKPLNWLDFNPNYPKDPKTLGEYVKKWRMDKGLFQEELAELLGVAEMTIANWERGRTRPIIHKLQKIKDILKIEP